MELKRYKRHDDDKKKRTLTLKATNLFDEEDEDLDEAKTNNKQDEITLLSKKLQKILRDKINKDKRKTLFQKKVLNKNDQTRPSNTSTNSNT